RCAAIAFVAAPAAGIASRVEIVRPILESGVPLRLRNRARRRRNEYSASEADTHADTVPVSLESLRPEQSQCVSHAVFRSPTEAHDLSWHRHPGARRGNFPP